ncbi:MAG: M14 family zinc carboxypeptidase [Ilumatobacteraceae bacterium]
MAGSLVAVPLFMASCQPACEPAPPAAPRVVEQRQIGTSVQGRPITAYRLGTAGGTVVLAIGSIHGDEQAGIEIIEHIRDAASIPAGFDVWVVPTINPDGNVANAEPNAAGIDLNRNFPPNWEPIDCPTNPTNCSGPEPLSEPESRAVAALITEIKPRMTVWYHAVGPVVDQATLNGVANPAVLTTYGATAGYGVATVNCGPTGYCIGNATQFGNFTVAGSSAFVVELSTKALGGLTPAGVDAHANAFWAAAAVA